ncbi:hypothetical protein [Pseudomonas sp. OHS18]
MTTHPFHQMEQVDSTVAGVPGRGKATPTVPWNAGWACCEPFDRAPST